jgi:hypothetical protein
MNSIDLQKSNFHDSMKNSQFVLKNQTNMTAMHTELEQLKTVA